MYKNWKKMLSLLMVAAMLISILPISVSAQSVSDATVQAEYTEPVATMPTMPPEPVATVPTMAPEPPMPSDPMMTAPTMATEPAAPTTPSATERQTWDVTITEAGERVEFTFTPTQSGMYRISTNGTQTEVHIFDEDGRYVIEGAGWDFLKLYQYLEEGMTYTLKTGYNVSKTGSYQLVVESSPLQSITFTPITVTEGTCGSVCSEWNPETGEYDLEYYQYSLGSLLYKTTYTATFADGAVLTGSDAYLEYGGDFAWFNYHSNQDYNNQWTAGNTYTLTVEVMGIETEIPVTITSSPLQSITFEPIEVMEGTCGSFNYDWNPDTNEYDLEHYIYDSWYMLERTTYTVTFIDGTVLEGSGTGFEYNGEYFSFDPYTTDQTYTDPWTAGNTYTVYVKVMGICAEIPVTITQSPLLSVTFSPVSVIENTNGEYRHGTEYFEYYGWALLGMSHYTAVFRDGTVIEGSSNSGFEHEGQWYEFAYGIEQSEENPLTVGNTYYMKAFVHGITASIEIPVTIRRSPVVSMSFAPISMEENSDGSWIYYYNAEIEAWDRYFVYHWWNNLSYTVTMDDGEIISGIGSGFYYDEVYYSFEYDDSQDEDYANCWISGNTYTMSASAMGVSAEVEITIELPLLESITFEPVVLLEEQSGYWSYDWDSESETSVRYYRYDWFNSVAFTLTFRDGTVKKGVGYDNVEYNGKNYRISYYDDNQSGKNPWLPGNTYEASARFEEKDYAVYVTIDREIEDNGYEYLIQDGKAIITNCTLQTEILQIPKTLGGYPVTGITGLGDALQYAKELRIPDGVTMMSSKLLTPSPYGNRTIPLEKLSLGSGISTINGNDLKSATSLKWIDVSADNIWMKSIDGVLYDAEVTTLLAFPAAKEALHVIPDSVTDIDIFFTDRYIYAQQFANPNIRFGAGIKDYKMVDGVIYNADMTEVLLTTPAANGQYKMPESVTSIGDYAFMDSDLTAVEISPNVTEITYPMFYGHILLEEISIPTGVTTIEWPRTYSNLWKVNITDLEHWTSGIEFWNNPLQYAHNLYLNGEKIVDLVLPESVDKVNDCAFYGGSFETVTLPAKAMCFGYEVFLECENLKGVYITDLNAWVNSTFGSAFSNPLCYAGDLYLNGKKVVDLVLPESADITAIRDSAFYNASIQSITIPGNISEIGNEAFSGCENLTKVNISDLSAWCGISFGNPTANPLYYAHDLYLKGEKIVDLVLPETVKEVKSYAFYRGSMTSLFVPALVERIDDAAFADSSLEQIQFSEGLTSIGYDAFRNTEVQILFLPDSLTSIGGSAFYNCGNLETVVFGSKLEQIEYNAFSNTALNTVSLPDSLTYLGSCAFESCTALESVNLGNGLEEIDSEAFAGTGLKSVTLPKQLTYIGYRAFANAKLEELIIDCDSVAINSDAFANCPLGDLEFGSNVSYIEMGAFMGTNATQIKLPDSVTDITYRAFAFNENLVSITIPESITSISDASFEGSHKLRHVLYTGTQEKWEAMKVEAPEILQATIHFGAKGNEVVTSQTCTTVTFYCSICQKEETVRKGKINHEFVDGVCSICGVDSCWEYIVDEKTGTVTITDYAGSDREVVVPDTIEGMPVTAFTQDVFSYNRLINTVTLPEGITEIPDGAFYKCTSLHTVNVGDSLVSVGMRAFYECTNIRSIHLPDSVETIGEAAFHSTGLSSFTFPKALTELGDLAFCNCELETLEIPATLKKIGAMTFADCRYLTTVTVSETVTAIGDNAFEGCSRLTTLSIGSNVRVIGAEAFANTKLELVLFHGDCPDMKDSFGDSSATAFYPADKQGWDTVKAGNMKWYACMAPEILKQPVDTTAADGAVLAVEAYGQRLRYQWYYAKSGSDEFVAIGGDSIELALDRNEVSGGGKAYCLITDVLGQTAETNIVTIQPAAPKKVQDTKAKFASTGLSLGTFIGLQSAIMKSTLNGGNFDEAYFIYEQYSYNAGGVLEQVATIRGEYIDMGSYYVSECPVNAKQMSDIYKITPYYVKDGVIYYGTSTVTSVKTESMKKVKATATDEKTLKTKALCIAMLNYGAEAQKNFSYSLTNLANSQLTASQKVLPAFDSLNLTKTNTIPTTPFKPASAGLSLGDVVYMQLLVSIKNVDAAGKLLYQIIGEDPVEIPVSELEIYGGAYYIINIPVKAKHVRTNTAAALFNAQGQRIYGYMICSVEAFAVAKKGTKTETLAAALMAYGDAAKAVFG